MKGRLTTTRRGLHGGLGALIVRAIATLCICLLGVSASGQAGGGQGTAKPLSAGRSAKDVAIITIRGEIDRWTAFSVDRRIEKAERDGADALVFEIDSPGGELWPVLMICASIKGSQVANTVAWVRPSAYSGGAIIGLACREMVVSENATFGDALPVSGSPVGGMMAMPDAEREKVMGPLLVEVVDSARRNGYDEIFVQSLVRRGVELWLVENNATAERYFVTEAEATAAIGKAPERTSPTVPSATGPVGGGSGGPRAEAPQPDADSTAEEGVSPTAQPEGPLAFRPADPSTPRETLNEVNNALEMRSSRSVRPDFRSAEHAGRYTIIEYVADGHGVMTLKSRDLLRYGLAAGTVQSDSDLTAHFGAQNIVRLDETWSEGLARFLTLFWVRGLLVALFLICLFVEMTHPGVTAPGLVAAAALLALIIPPLLVNMAAWWEVAAIFAGILLIILELFVIPGFGFAGVGGVVLLFGGLIGTFVGGSGLFPGSTQGREELTTGVLTVVISAITSGGAIYMLARHLPSTPLLGRLVLKDNEDGPTPTMLQAMAIDAGGVSVGDLGSAATPLRPAGRVLIGERMIDAVAEHGYIESGVMVRVVSADAFRIAVERVEGHLHTDARGQGASPG